ncbi:inactive non-canonical poly(A) RNA polymerase protein Trf4-2 [Scaptodrosophila lebanonensis]|uniref:polynucleotide adenylyltransferase n=1 Tax=Drosophila lebanonensis TaxID=7225 RepID=A0A6J2T8Q0_DROLE|nr:inactive non-canonical poly(A) RNA polymerase protein Trf4-2 [Scaptodrosophila lebanonensis]
MGDEGSEHLVRPWQLPNYYYGAGVVGLHQEIEHFYNYILATPTELAMRAETVRRVKNLLLSLWPDACVEVFGSSRTDLFLPASDIDVVVIGYWGRTPLYDLEKELIARQVALQGSVCVLDKASVPVVKFTERESQIKFDISFNVDTGLKAAELINEFKHKYPEMPKLVMVLKQFLTMHSLNEVYTGGISSYGLTLMCISFLQQQIHMKKYKYKNKLGMLLLRFLDFYGRKFDYFKYGISVRGDGSNVERSQLQTALADYNWQSVLCIEDPITPTNDIGRSSYAALYVKEAFESAYLKLSKLVDSDSTKVVGSILGCIVDVPPDVLHYRQWVHRNFQHLSLRGNVSPKYKRWKHWYCNYDYQHNNNYNLEEFAENVQVDQDSTFAGPAIPAANTVPLGENGMSFKRYG